MSPAGAPWRFGAWIVGSGLLTALFYAASVKAFAGDSDGATAVLEGQSISDGNVLLHSWALSVDSFWGIDAVANAVAVRIFGLRPMLLHLVPAIIAAGAVLVGVLIVRVGHRGVAAAAATLTVLLLLGLPSHFLAYFLLRGPLHVGTTLYCLLTFYWLRRGRFGWGWIGAVVLLALGLLSDLQMVALGLVPVVVAGALAMVRLRKWQEGAATVGAATASVVLAVVVRQLSDLLGTFHVGKVQPAASSSERLRNLGDVFSGVRHLMGVGGGDIGTAGVPLAIQAVHLIGLVVVGLALLAALWRVFVALVRGPAARTSAVGLEGSDRPGAVNGPSAVPRSGAGHRRVTGAAERTDPDPDFGADAGARDDATADTADDWWRLDDLLLLGCAGGVAVFVTLSISSSDSYDRYLTSAVIFGAVLAGRMVGRATAWCRSLPWASSGHFTSHAPHALHAAAPRRRSGILGRAAALAGAGLVACYGAGTVFTVTATTPPDPAASLAHFLEANDLHRGIGDYWSASIITVLTGGKVTVRPVTSVRASRVVRYQRQSSASWYAGQHFRFLVYDTANLAAVDTAMAKSTFGQPSHTYYVGSYAVLVWPHPLSVSAVGFDPG